MKKNNRKTIVIVTIIAILSVVFSSCSFDIQNLIRKEEPESSVRSTSTEDLIDRSSDNNSENTSLYIRRFMPTPQEQTTGEPTTEEPATVPTTTEKQTERETTTKKQEPTTKWEPVTQTPAHEGFNDVVLSVIRGDYGNGAERKRRLRADGFDPEEVQREVNRALGYEEEPAN